jgi:hypothetical protein
MNAQSGSGWQTVLADLSLILFMVTASVVSSQAGKSGSRTPPAPAPATAAPARSEPVAIYRPLPGAPPLREWLAEQGVDPRQQLTIVVPYAPDGQGAAFERARDMARSAGINARVILEPGEPASARATLGYDRLATSGR